MHIRIFDVAHGFCALIMADNGNLMLIDCGDDGDNFRPSEYLRSVRCSGIEYFFISNYDHDHVSDLPNVRKTFPINVLVRNKSLAPDQLQALKEEECELSDALLHTLDMHRNYNSPVTNPPDLCGIEYRVFCNSYPTFADTNNLSMVTFVYYDGFCIAFTGDLEVDGWRALLKNPQFVENLKRVNVFVASHHGRESGYCAEVFEVCRPDVVVISDKEMIYGTQENCYAKHARGYQVTPSGKRYVVTTRNDGHIVIQKQQGQPYQIVTTRYKLAAG